MKTAIEAKIIFESDEFVSYDCPTPGFPRILTVRSILEVINSGDYEIEAIDNMLSNKVEPVLIIKHKLKK